MRVETTNQISVGYDTIMITSSGPTVLTIKLFSKGQAVGMFEPRSVNAGDTVSIGVEGKFKKTIYWSEVPSEPEEQ